MNIACSINGVSNYVIYQSRLSDCTFTSLPTDNINLTLLTQNRWELRKQNLIDWTFFYTQQNLFIDCSFFIYKGIYVTHTYTAAGNDVAGLCGTLFRRRRSTEESATIKARSMDPRRRTYWKPVLYHRFVEYRHSAREISLTVSSDPSCLPLSSGTGLPRVTRDALEHLGISPKDVLVTMQCTWRTTQPAAYCLT